MPTWHAGLDMTTRRLLCARSFCRIFPPPLTQRAPSAWLYPCCRFTNMPLAPSSSCPRPLESRAMRAFSKNTCSIEKPRAKDECEAFPGCSECIACWILPATHKNSRERHSKVFCAFKTSCPALQQLEKTSQHIQRPLCARVGGSSGDSGPTVWIS
jgi:hypothetical protein